MSKSLVQKERIVSKRGTYQGREVLAFFAVTEGIDGYSFRLIDVRYTGVSEVVALSVAKAKSAPVTPIESPYFESSKDFTSDFSFIVSQPTRAPASK